MRRPESSPLPAGPEAVNRNPGRDPRARTGALWANGLRGWAWRWPTTGPGVPGSCGPPRGFQSRRRFAFPSCTGDRPGGDLVDFLDQPRPVAAERLGRDQRLQHRGDGFDFLPLALSSPDRVGVDSVVTDGLFVSLRDMAVQKPPAIGGRVRIRVTGSQYRREQQQAGHKAFEPGRPRCFFSRSISKNASTRARNWPAEKLRSSM